MLVGQFCQAALCGPGFNLRQITVSKSASGADFLSKYFNFPHQNQSISGP